MLKYYWYRLVEQLDSLSLYVRLGIFVGVYIVVSLIFYILWVSPVMSQTGSIQTKTEQAQRQHRVLEAKAKNYRQQTQQEQKAKLEQLEKRLADIEQQLEAYRNSLLAPKDLASILEAILHQEPNVEVHRLQKQGSKKVSLLSKKGKKKQSSSHIYRVSYGIEYQGDFYNTFNYMQRLQNLPWHMYWQSLQYRVVNYPRAEVKLKVDALVDRGAS